MNKFIISESEKQRILEMHQNATSRNYLMEENGFNPTPYVTAYVNAVKSAMPNYSNAEGEKQTPNGSTIFGQTFYNTPMEISKARQTILSNIGKIQGLVIGKGVRGKELQSACIPKITKGNEQFLDGNFCFAFQNTNKANFPKYAAMNTAYNNLFRYIQNFNSPTQKD